MPAVDPGQISWGSLRHGRVQWPAAAAAPAGLPTTAGETAPRRQAPTAPPKRVVWATSATPHPYRSSGQTRVSPRNRAAAAMRRLLRRCSIANVDLNQGSSDDTDEEEERLLGIADQQLTQAFADGSWGPIATALDQFESFARTVNRILFLGLNGTHEQSHRALRHNETTLRMFLAFLSELTSRKPRPGLLEGPALQGPTMEQYVTHVRTAFSIHTGGRVDGSGLLIAKQVKGLKRSHTHRVKKVRLPFLSTHFRATSHAAPSPDGAGAYSVAEVNKWALLCVMHATLARSGEMGGPEKFSADGGLSRAHIIYFPEGSGDDKTPFAVVMLRPLKSGAGCFDRVPVVVAKGDGSWADAYTVLCLLEKVDPVSGGARATTPAFRTGHRRQFLTREITTAVRTLCVAAGLDPDMYSSHSLRIGGATDLAQSGGTEVECRLAGRWHSDVWQIYARPCLAMQVASSVRLCLAESVDIESMLRSAGVTNFNAIR